jgi:predicted HTH transcriptional regulator
MREPVETPPSELGSIYRKDVTPPAEELENWLAMQLDPRIDFKYFEFREGDKDVVIVEVPCARHAPVAFRGTRSIRVGSYTKCLRDFPDKERKLWLILSLGTFEQEIAKEGASGEDVLAMLDYSAFAELVERPATTDTAKMLAQFTDEAMIQTRPDGCYDITSLGAILFAKKLDEFDTLRRKALRVIQYSGPNRAEAVKEIVGSRGYASGFKGAIGFITRRLPYREVMREGIRENRPVYPIIAVRELVANALIHQDFRIRGTGPKVELFSDRMEISNPGQSLVEPLRFLGSAPRSRNESMAALMRRARICEERGSGILKVIIAVEEAGLPGPRFETSPESTRAVLFGPKPLSDMTVQERVLACYWHSCLQHVNGDAMTNATLRKRLSVVGPVNALAVWRIIQKTGEEGLVKRSDPLSTSRRHAAYKPVWA